MGEEEGMFPSWPKASPWLVIPYGKSGTPPRKQAFYDICEPSNDGSSTCRKSIPELIAKTYIQKPSHQGWLIILCSDETYDYNSLDDNYKYGDCFLWNPATSQTIHLPSLLEWLDGYHLGDCVFATPPPDHGDDIKKSLVLFVFSDAEKGNCDLVFLYCLPGDKEWRTYKWYSETIPVQDMVSLHYFKHDFYVMCTGMQHLRIGYVLAPEGNIHLFVDTIKVMNLGSYPLVGGLGTTYLTYNFVATGDALYCIPITYTLRGFRKVVIHMVVMWLDLSVMVWRLSYDIGDRVLFISCDGTTTACCSAADTGLARSCVYFTLPDDQCLYKFDIQSTGNAVVGPLLKVPKGWKGAQFIMMPNIQSTGNAVVAPPLKVPKGWSDRQKRKREEPMVGEDEHRKNKAAHTDLPEGVSKRLYPWLMFNRDHNYTNFTFINSMHKLMLPSLEQTVVSFQKELRSLEHTVVRFQKGGWLLMSMEGNRFGLFFYNPFTRQTIKLPLLPVAYTFSSISFSSLPTSSDCVVFAIQQVTHRKVHLYFIRKGSKAWSYRVFKNNAKTKHYMPSPNTPVFYNGDFYFADYNGSLGVLKIEDGGISWKVLEKPHKPFDGVYPSFLVECDGKLLLVKMGRLGTLVGIFRLDFSRMHWVKIENLAKHMLFVSYTSCFSAIAPDSRMENKVYFPRVCMNGEGVLFYCLKTCSYRSFGRHSAADFTGTEGWYLNCTWIEPNWTKSTAQEACWVKCPSSSQDCAWTEPNWSMPTAQELGSVKCPPSYANCTVQNWPTSILPDLTGLI